MLGTFINAGAIVLGVILGLTFKPLSAKQQAQLKILLGVSAVVFGFKLIWQSLNGTFLQILAQFGIVTLAMILGHLTGKLLHLQKTSNRLGQYARAQITNRRTGAMNQFNDGFMVCTLLFCLAPLAWLGSVSDGLSGYFYPLIVKGLMDGLACMTFAAMFGPGVILSALPVMALQGTITLLCTNYALPFLDAHSVTEHGLINSVNATVGMLLACIALLIFEIKKFPVTDYLPSLIYAPLLTWWWVK